MATQGLLSVVDKNGKVVMKVVCGCNGYEIPKLKKMLKGKELPATTSGMYNRVLYEAEVGCDRCLVVIDSAGLICEDGIFEWADIPDSYKLYKETFSDPKFNPRWAQGIADYTEILGVK